MKRMMKTSRPTWTDEGTDVETAAVVWGDELEYRMVGGADHQGLTPDGQEGLRAGGPEGLNPDGAEAVSRENNPDSNR